jgi:hypothetical protein
MFNDDELVYLPEGARYPLLELDKLFLIEERQFEIYREKYLGYFENDLERLQQEKEKIQGWQIKNRRFDYKKYLPEQGE